MRVAEGTRGETARRSASRASLPQEHVVARLRQSGRRLVLPAVLFVVLCGGTGYWWGRLGSPFLDTALPVAAAALALLLCAMPLLRWFSRVIIVTDRRLIVSRGFVIRSRRDFVIAPGIEATLRRGPLQLLAGSGDVVVRSGDGKLVLRDVSSAKLVHGVVLELASRPT